MPAAAPDYLCAHPLIRTLGALLHAEAGLVTVVIGLERAGNGQAEIFGLSVAELGELDADLVEVQGRDLLVEVLGQRIDLLLVVALVVQFPGWARPESCRPAAASLTLDL